MVWGRNQKNDQNNKLLRHSWPYFLILRLNFSRPMAFLLTWEANWFVKYNSKTKITKICEKRTKTVFHKNKNCETQIKNVFHRNFGEIWFRIMFHRFCFRKQFSYLHKLFVLRSWEARPASIERSLWDLSIGGVFGTIPLRGADLQDICDRVFFYYQLDRKPKHGRSEQRAVELQEI